MISLKLLSHNEWVHGTKVAIHYDTRKVITTISQEISAQKCGSLRLTLYNYTTIAATTSTTTSATTESIPDDNTAVITGSVIGSISFVLLVVIILVVCSVRRYKKVKQLSR